MPRHTIIMAALAAVLPLSVGACAGPVPVRSPTPTQYDEQTVGATEARQEGSNVIAKLRKLDDEAVPTSPSPSSVECGPRSTEGVEFHWAVQGAATDDPREYAARAVAILKGAGFSTSQTISELNDTRLLYFVGGESTSGAQVALSASAMNTVLQVSSACANGDAADFD